MSNRENFEVILRSSKNLYANLKQFCKDNNSDQVMIHRLGDLWGHIDRLELSLMDETLPEDIINSAAYRLSIESKGIELLLEKRYTLTPQD